MKNQYQISKYRVQAGKQHATQSCSIIHSQAEERRSRRVSLSSCICHQNSIFSTIFYISLLNFTSILSEQTLSFSPQFELTHTYQIQTYLEFQLSTPFCILSHLLKILRVFEMLTLESRRQSNKKNKMQKESEQQCEHCLKHYPADKISTHSAYCRRNFKHCPKCSKMFDKNYQTQHEQQHHHRLQICPHCGNGFSIPEIAPHERTCTKKVRYCQYCDLNVPIRTYATHLKACESRTQNCSNCNLPVMKKEYYGHVVTCQGPREEIVPEKRVLPEPRYQRLFHYRGQIFDQPQNTVDKKKILDLYKTQKRQGKEESNGYLARQQIPRRVEAKRQQFRQYLKSPNYTATHKEEATAMQKDHPEVPGSAKSTASVHNNNQNQAVGQSTAFHSFLNPKQKSRQCQPTAQLPSHNIPHKIPRVVNLDESLSDSQRQQSPPHHASRYSKANPVETHGLSTIEDRDLQLAIMQSLEQGRGVRRFGNQMTPSAFIEQQKVIEAELKMKRK